MSDKIEPQVEALFHQVVEMSANEQEAYLAEHCDDPSIRAEVQELLQADRLYEGRPTEEAESELLERENEVSSRIGRYKLLQKIGEGGMGDVYMAEQTEPVHRRVALKIIKLGMDTKQVVARFEAERQALAMMDHPNIAKVLDAGTTETGRPYFVMELVQGIRITEFCKRNGLSTRDRLQLLIPVCRAIQSAHGKGVIHRDIKPSNILVTVRHDEPMPMVIDFGIAKAVNQKLTEKTYFTKFAAMIGTPGYMSPEQAEMTSMDVDTRSDIYSLGAVLYELLTGTTPFEEQRLRDAGYGEMCRIIKEEHPEKPSTRVTRLSGLGSSGRIERGHSAGVPKPHELARDLDWIVMKCLEKDRTRRYETANGLAMDLKRHLDNEPVTARPPSAAYRFQKAWRRNKLVFSAGLTVVAALLLATMVSLWQMSVANQRSRDADAARLAEARQRRVAQKERDQANLAKRLAENERSRAEREKARADEQLYALNVSAAAQSSDLAWSLRRLDACDPARRGWEWHRLRFMCDTSRKDFAISAGQPKFALLPEQQIVVVDSEGTMQIHQMSDGVDWSLIDKVEVGYEILQVQTNHDRTLLVLYGRRTDDTLLLQLWRSAGLQLVHEFSGLPNSIKHMAISPVEDSMICLSSGEVLIWDLMSPEPKRRFHGEYQSVAYHPNGRIVAFGGIDVIREFNVDELGEDAAPLRTMGTNGQVDPLQYSHGGQQLCFLAGARGSVLLLNRDSNVQREVSGLDIARFRSGAWVDVAPGGQRVLFADRNGVHIVNTASGEVLRRYPTGVTMALFSLNGERIIGARADGTISVWPERPVQFDLKAHVAPLREVTAHTDSSSIASCSLDGTVRIWDATTGTPIRTLFAHLDQVPSVQFSPDGRYLATAGWDNTIQLWDTENWNRVRAFVGKAPIWWVRFSPDGTMLASCGLDQIRLWDIASGIQLGTLRSAEDITDGIAFSVDGKYLVALAPNARLAIWSVKNGLSPAGELPFDFGGAWHQRCLQFSPDGSILAAGSVNAVVVFDWFDREQRPRVLPTNGNVHSICFSRDMPSRLLASTESGEVSVWNTKTSERLLTFDVGEAVWGIALTPDGRTLALALNSGTVRLWPAHQLSRHQVRTAIRNTKALGTIDTAFRAMIESGFDLTTSVADQIAAVDLDSDETRAAAMSMTASAVQFPVNLLLQHTQTNALNPTAPKRTYQQSVEAIERVLGMAPGYPRALAILGMLQYRLGNIEQSLDTLKSASSAYRTWGIEEPTDLYAALALTLHALGREEQARIQIQRAREVVSDGKINSLLDEADRVVHAPESR